MEEDDCIPFDLFSHLTEVRLLNTVLAITVGIFYFMSGTVFSPFICVNSFNSSSNLKL